MFKIIALVVAVALAGVLIYAATRPDTFSVQRSLAIKAPPEKIFPLIENFHRWSEWSPYEKLDPEMKRSYTGPDSGPGAAYAWDGSSKVGAGSMEILRTSVPGSIVIKLDFIRPITGHNTATFTLENAGDTTTVTWIMAGPSPYISKLMGLFFNMDQMIGKDFETGLANLKRIAERQ
ncbi:K(+)-transporting ATPase subunit F [Nevskia soli]|uniref:K(+)-transporting ATPase subunit F n=1 Tax=Nevskia soli TaxID=418856 RepID=UPI0004A71E7C|nr:K(+)-transporting ATPase subunit F [Nevskia soli]